METNMGAKKRGGYPKKSGNVYVGQWSQIKEKMEWNLMEGGVDDFCPQLEATSPIRGSLNDATPKKTNPRARLGGPIIECNNDEA